MFSGGTERDQWNEMGWYAFGNQSSFSNYHIEKKQLLGIPWRLPVLFIFISSWVTLSSGTLFKEGILLYIFLGETNLGVSR